MTTSSQTLRLGTLEGDFKRALSDWVRLDCSKRLWAKDPTLWVPNKSEAAITGDLGNRLGWLSLPEQSASLLKEFGALADDIRGDKFSDVVLLGMGGSSLAPETLMNIFSNAPGFPKLTVLDSTHPQAVWDIDNRIDLKKTLFLVCSKSGSTLETNSFFYYFYDRLNSLPDRGRHFIALTDPGSSLEKVAREREFRRIVSTPPEVGGRYSALSPFGMLPAALIGMDLDKFLERARSMMKACAPESPSEMNPGVILGIAMGVAAKMGRDKLTLVFSSSIQPLGPWIEQLVAESTGKHGKGILPVIDKTLEPRLFSDDRFVVITRLEGDNMEVVDRCARKLIDSGHPVLEITLRERSCVGAEFYRWEYATAVAGAILQINPFDQPNVESAKKFAREVMKTYERSGVLPALPPVCELPEATFFQSPALSAIGHPTSIESAARLLSAAIQKHSYFAVMAYLPPNVKLECSLQELAEAFMKRHHVAVTIGLGPRFLHSTGQLHKGDSGKGLFLQLTDTPAVDCKIPETPYSFSTVISAQAIGDFQALSQCDRKVMRIDIRNEFHKVLNRLAHSL